MKSNVDVDEIKVMGRAGVRGVQPGIESFVTSVLKRMKKGVTGIQNVLAIKQLMEHDIVVHYNVLFAFPGDEPTEYQELCRIIPNLFHLQPPYSYMPVLTTRYAPMQEGAAHGIDRASRCDPAYEMVFSRSFRTEVGFDVSRYCYVFERTYELSEDCVSWYAALIYQISHWVSIQLAREVKLSFESNDDGIIFDDSRFQETGRRSDYDWPYALIYNELGARIVLIDDLEERLKPRLGSGRVSRLLDDLEENRLILRERNRVMA